MRLLGVQRDRLETRQRASSQAARLATATFPDASMGFEGISRACKYLYLYSDTWEVSVKVRLAICQSALVCVGPPAHNPVVCLLQCSRRVLQVGSMAWLSIQGESLGCFSRMRLGGRTDEVPHMNGHP